jgi:serine/threonine protein kinase/Tol biopolymer transport system component
MGEVYRARDTRLDRHVAIKVLPAHVADDPHFRQRFETEARAISQLTHPNICTLHDVGEHEGKTFLVMEFLAGETLADRLARGTPEHPALTPDTALQIGIQIADALAVAHQRGIIHRDLKPGNVMLTKAGTGQAASCHAKLLDFGLAKTTPAFLAGDLSPTTPPQAVTTQGAILGTIQYMAPEQIEGGNVDVRSDIFAFGCLLYEMLTGRKAFEGKTHAGVMAGILEREPAPLSALGACTPPLVEATVGRCLAKSPEDRWQSAADLAAALRWAANAASRTPTVQAATTAVIERRRAGWIWRIAAGAALIGASVALGLWLSSRSSARAASAPARAVRFEVSAPPNANWSPSPVSSAAQLALAPDGEHLAFVAAPRRGVSQIWIRSLNALAARPLAGTEGALFPFWSPDSRFVAFFADGKLKKIDITGGVAQPLADAPSGRGGSWSPSGVIAFTPSPSGGISRVSSEGGAVTSVTTFQADQSVTAHYWPQFLPDGRHVMYYQRSAKPEYQGVYITDIESQSTKQILASDGRAVYVPGYLLMVREGMLFARPFDDQRLEITGEPIRVADAVGYFGGTFGDAAVTGSATGVLAHGPDVALTTVLQWRDRSGAVIGTPLPPGAYQGPRLSPDQKNVALAIVDRRHSSSPDVWVMDLSRGTLSRVTSDPRSDWFPLWSPDGGRLYFSSTRAGTSSLFQKGSTGAEESLTGPTTPSTYATDVVHDGSLLVYQQITRDGYDLGTMATSGDHKKTPFLATRFNEVQARLSPNGRWIAHASDESGRFEVYVRPFPSASEQWTISVAGGMQPEWRRDGKELFYVAADGRMMAVPVTTDGATFSAGTPHALFDVEIAEPTAPYPTDYAVSADGQRFFVNTVVDQPVRQSLTVILNWAAELKRDASMR